MKNQNDDKLVKSIYDILHESLTDQTECEDLAWNDTSESVLTEFKRFRPDLYEKLIQAAEESNNTSE
jgi:pheromone shutdown protein TraB